MSSEHKIVNVRVSPREFAALQAWGKKSSARFAAKMRAEARKESKARAERGRALAFWIEQHYEDAPETNIVDALADLQHAIATIYGDELNVLGLASMARNHYENEVKEAGR